MEIALKRNPKDNVTKNFILLGFGMLIIIFLTIIFSAIGDNSLLIILISGIPLMLFVVLNFRLTYSIIIFTLFINLLFQWLNTAVLFAIFIPLSYLICFTNIKSSEFQLPITFPLALYSIVMILSIFNSIDPLFSIRLMYNMFVFIMLVYISPSAVRHTKEIIGYLVLFLVLTSLNSLHVIFEGLSTKIRVFGFAGVMISDYVGIAIIMNFILLLFSKKNGYRLLLILTFILFIVTLFVIQTRNAWISTFLCLFLLIIYLLFNAKKMEMRRSIPVIALLTSILFIGSVFLFVSSIKPEVTERLEQNKKLEETVDQSGQVQSSLIMRLMIWHTAYIAFSENPVLGIGAYSFPVSSYQYYKVPKLFFKKYIEGLSPHITYLAVATETGVIGLICFLIFLITSLKFSYDTLKYSKSFEDKAISLLLFWPLVYIALSMFMTDTWLWGQGIVLWGILLGFNMWNRKRIFRKINFN